MFHKYSIYSLTIALFKKPNREANELLEQNLPCTSRSLTTCSSHLVNIKKAPANKSLPQIMLSSRISKSPVPNNTGIFSILRKELSA